MQYVEYRPSPPLRPFINCFWWIESGDALNAAGPVWDRTLPDGCLEVVLHLGDPMLRRGLDSGPERESRAILIGQTTRPYLFAATGRVCMLGVRFFPHTASQWLRTGVAEFNDQSVDLEALLPAVDRLPTAAIDSAVGPEAGVRVLENYFLRRFERMAPGRQDRYIQHACRRILTSRGTSTISALSRELGISNRYLERLFLAQLGVPPKFFARIIRFQGVFATLSGMFRHR